MAFPSNQPIIPTWRQVIRLAKKHFDLDALKVEVIHQDALEFLRKAGKMTPIGCIGCWGGWKHRKTSSLCEDVPCVDQLLAKIYRKWPSCSVRYCQSVTNFFKNWYSMGQKHRGYHFPYKSQEHVTPPKCFVRLYSVGITLLCTGLL